MATSTRRRRWSLEELDAQWIDVPRPRHNVALKLRCPFHDRQHWLVLRMHAPYDGSPGLEGEGVLVELVYNGGLSTMTLAAPGYAPERPIFYPGHGRFRIIDGFLEIVLD